MNAPYQDRIIRVIDHIHANPGADLRLDELADIEVMSRFHWPNLSMRGVFLDDPMDTPEPDLRSFAGLIVAPNFAMPAPLQKLLVPAGRHAVLTCQGPYAGFSAAYDYLYCSWPPGSGQEVGVAPVYEHYLNTPADTAPDALLTELCLPMAEV